MKKIILLVLALNFIVINLNGQLSKRSKYAEKVENFSLWLLPSYLPQENQLGFNGKISYEMEKFLVLSGQSSYFLNNVNSHSFGEYRAELGFYIFLTPKRKFSPFLYFGLSQGWWWSEHYFDYEGGTITEYRKLTEIDFSNSHDDQSGSFSVGFSYEVGRNRAILEYKYLPEVRSNYVSLGMQFRFFKGTKYKLKPGRINK